MTKQVQNIVIQALLEKKERLIEELEQVNDALQSEGYNIDSNIKVDAVEIPSKDNYRGYDKSWSLSKKFVFLLKVHNRFLHFREAAEMINQIENTGLEDTELASKLSSGTQNLKSEGVIVKYQFDKNNKNSFWGRPNWLDDQGEIIKGHEYDEKYVYKKNASGKDLFDSF
ncbi:hypothetical protein V8G61_09565 [Gaetbulibacter sp. M240]|uniref:hypothetical protein n=1 Tax=Gaetbulibacter sp. M240 TaxID=3126511 RepID=UPI00374FD4A8